MDDNSNSIYNLVTELSEKFASRLNGSQRKNIRRLRRKCYEILLTKRDREIEPQTGSLLFTFVYHFINVVLACFKSNKDPFCHLLIWEFDLITKYNQREHAEKLRQCVRKLEECYSSNNETFNQILYLLLQLRKVPDKDDGLLVWNKMRYVLFFALNLFLYFRIKISIILVNFLPLFYNQITVF